MPVLNGDLLSLIDKRPVTKGLAMRDYGNLDSFIIYTGMLKILHG